MYKKTKLDNGLRIVTYRMPKMQSVALGIWIKVGSRYESDKRRGISHYLEHLLFKGTEKYSCRKIKESIEGVGGSLNGFTTEELTCYLVKIPGKYLDLALDILADMVIEPTLSLADIEKERGVILEEIKMYKDHPASYVYDLLDRLLWPKHPLGMSVLGTEETVASLQRKDLCLYKEQYHVSSNIVISAAGLLEEERFIQKVKVRFRHLGNGNINAPPPAKQRQNKPQIDILQKDTAQTHLALGFRSLKRDHPLKYAVALLHVILGANMSSRLFHELREKRGLAYEIGSLVKCYQDTGAFIVHAGIDNRKLEEAIILILKELGKLKSKLVNADEFRRAKEFYVGQLQLVLEDTLDQMLWMGESSVTLDKTYTLEQIIREIKKVKLEDLQEVAKIIFREDNLNLALIGPLKDRHQSIYNLLQICG